MNYRYEWPGKEDMNYRFELPGKEDMNYRYEWPVKRIWTIDVNDLVKRMTDR